MDLNKQSWIILLMFSAAGGAIINNIQNASSYLIPCEEGWYLFGDKCYKVFDKAKGAAWKTAEVRCAVNHGSLVTIQSAELQDFLTTFLLLDVKSNVWIGLHDRQDESNYAWADGSIVNYTYWDNGEPSGRSNHQEDCVEMRYNHAKKQVGMWNDLNCDVNLPYICQANKSEQSMTDDPRFCTGENVGAWKYQNSCYHAVNEEMSWDDAENYCQTVFSGHLLTILDSKTEVFLNNILSDFEREFWIGIKIREGVQQMWSSVWLVKYKKWEPGHNHFVNGTCAYTTEAKFWSSAPCFEKFPFVCEVPHVKPPPLKQAPKGWRCPELSQDWIDLGGDTCYIFETSKSKKWHEAMFACLKKGGHLASISSAAETNAIHPRVLGAHERMLIGLHRSLSNNSVFEWADGTVLDYQNWKIGEPNGKDEACGEIWTEDMEWNDVPCDNPKGYICSAKKVPPYLLESKESDLLVGNESDLLVGSNESASIDSQQLAKTSCSGESSSNITLTVLFVAVIVIFAVVLTIYVYKNYYRKSNYQGWKYFAMSFSAKNRPMSNELTPDE